MICSPISPTAYSLLIGNTNNPSVEDYTVEDLTQDQGWILLGETRCILKMIGISNDCTVLKLATQNAKHLKLLQSQRRAFKGQRLNKLAL